MLAVGEFWTDVSSVDELPPQAAIDKKAASTNNLAAERVLEIFTVFPLGFFYAVQRQSITIAGACNRRWIATFT